MKLRRFVLIYLFSMLMLGLIGNFRSFQIRETYASGSEPSTYALDFDGDTDYVQIEDSESLNFSTGDFTISCWFKTSEQQPALGKSLVVKHNAAWSQYFILEYNGDAMSGTALFDIYNGSSHFIESDFDVRDGQWHHLVALRDGDNLKLYMDNKLNDTRGGVDTVIFDNNAVMAIGGSIVDNAYWVNGTIDDIVFFNRAWNTTEITYAYNSGVGRYSPLDTTGMVAWYKFDEGSGTSLYDRSANSNHGTISNATWGTGVTPDWYSTDQFYIQPNYNGTLSTSSTSYSSSGPHATLSFNITGSSGITSTTEVYCGTKEKPYRETGPAVVGVDSWSYTSGTQILTITIDHSSTQQVIVYWWYLEESVSGGTIIDDVDFLMLYLKNLDFVGFFIACYTTRIGEAFYALVMLAFSVVLYNRTESLPLLCILWLLVGSLGFMAAAPSISPFAVILMSLGIIGLIYKVVWGGT